MSASSCRCWFRGLRCPLTVTKNQELLALANGDLSKQRKEVVRHTLRVLAHDTTRVAASGVEVPQQRSVELVTALAGLLGLRALSVDVVGDHGLDAELGVAIRVGGTERAVLGDGDHVGEARGIAVDSRRRGEDDVGDIVLGHALEEAERAEDVHAVVLERDLAGLADGLFREEVSIPVLANGPSSHSMC